MRYTVVLCAHDAARRLPPTLEALAALDYDPRAWELLLVDNASTDDTVAVATTHWTRLGHSVPLRIVAEPQLGLSAARARGAAEANGEVLVFCDDDNELAPDYFTCADAVFATFGDRVLIGGAAIGVREGGEEIAHLTPDQSQALALGPQSGTREDVTVSRGWLMGAGLIVPRDAFAELRAIGFQPRLGDRRGGELTTGGDVELCYALTLLGWQTISEPQLILRHRLPAHRLTQAYLAQLAQGNAATADLLALYQLLRLDRFQPRPWPWRIARRLVFAVRHRAYRADLLRYACFGQRAHCVVLPLRLMHASAGR